VPSRILLYFVRLPSASANERIYSVMDPKYLWLSNGERVELPQRSVDFSYRPKFSLVVELYPPVV
jgi:hypothetical protein